jgi:glycosyltransferase involved in cell wall biosynthesis
VRLSTLSSPWLLVAGDFTPLGGMDAANHALARYLGATRLDRGVHLVTHRAWPDLHALPRVTVHGVRRPFGHALGSSMLARAGHRVWKRLEPLGVQPVVNGGNCAIPGAVNWVHYLHAAYRPAVAASPLRRAKSALTHGRDLAAERAALAEAPLVICNSRLTRDDVVRHLGVEPSRTRVVYYGGDPHRFSHVMPEARAAARARFGWPAERPLVAFVGALGDRRKAFDTVFEAWVRLCADARWDADLLVVGSGAEQSAWAHKAREQGCGDRIRFVGFRSDVPDLLAAVDALVHPARYEAYGLSVREALSRGIPAIVSRSAGVAEEMPASLDDLLLDKPDDAEELAERLRLWRRNRDALDLSVAALGDRLRGRTWDHMAAEIVAAVEAMASVR